METKMLIGDLWPSWEFIFIASFTIAAIVCWVSKIKIQDIPLGLLYPMFALLVSVFYILPVWDIPNATFNMIASFASLVIMTVIFAIVIALFATLYGWIRKQKKLTGKNDSRHL